MTTTTYTVAGMTCAHCVAAVTDELSRLDGVTDVAIELKPTSDSAVTVTSEHVLDVARVCDAVDEAGYQVTATR